MRIVKHTVLNRIDRYISSPNVVRYVNNPKVVRTIAFTVLNTDPLLNTDGSTLLNTDGSTLFKK